MKYQQLLTEITDILIADIFKEYDDIPPETISQARQLVFDTFSPTWDIRVNAAINQGHTQESLKTLALQVYNQFYSQFDLEQMLIAISKH